MREGFTDESCDNTSSTTHIDEGTQSLEHMLAFLECKFEHLRICREAISGKGKEGKVIIIDIAIDEVGDDREMTELKLDYDLVMLTMFNGKEREKKEWEKLIYEAGFSNYKIIPICGFKSLIEVYP